MMEPPKGPRTGCAFYPLLSVRIISVCVCVRVSSLMFITVSFSQTHCRCALQGPAFMVSWSICA